MPLLTTITLLLVLTSLTPSSSAHTNTFLRCLSTCNLSTITYTDNSPNYTSTLQNYMRNNRFNTTATPKPSVIVTPTHESQIQEIVKCAKKTNVQLKIRSGGHDYEGLSYTSDGACFAILDMFNLRSIDINLRDETAWVGSGATLGELYYKIWEQSKVHAFPAGVCPTVGIGGHISGGGYGNMLRKYGISADNVLDAKIVNADGKFLDRESMGEDLFWAIRGGGGGSFGVITSYKIKLVRVPVNVTVFNVSRTLEQNTTDLVHRWQYVAPRTDENLFIRVFLLPSPTKTEGKLSVEARFIAMFLGSAQDLESLMGKEFPQLGLKIEDCKEMPWIRSILFWAEYPDKAPETALLDRGLGHSNTFKMKSDYVKSPIREDGMRRVLTKMTQSKSILMMFNPYGGAMSEIRETAIAFPHRAGNLYKIQYLLFWKETGDDAKKQNIDNIREFHRFMTPFVSSDPREAFLNYRDLDNGITDNGANAYDQAKAFGKKYFKGNFDRLVKVKTAVDPSNFFRNEQSIPTFLPRY